MSKHKREREGNKGLNSGSLWSHTDFLKKEKLTHLKHETDHQTWILYMNTRTGNFLRMEI